jgi:hypothetical protein
MMFGSKRDEEFEKRKKKKNRRRITFIDDEAVVSDSDDDEEDSDGIEMKDGGEAAAEMAEWCLTSVTTTSFLAKPR